MAPLAIEGFAGVTAIDWSAAPPTESTVEPTMELKVALMELVPTATPVARPAEVMVATEVVAEAHVT